MRRCALTLGVLSVLSVASAQSVPVDASRSGPTPPRVEAHGAIAFVREFSAVRSGEDLRVVYTENGPRGRSTLRSALLHAEGGALLRRREDLTLADDARTLALAFAGDRGAVAYVIPRHPAAPLLPGARPVRRAPVVGVPASTRDPLGPSNLSGGDVVVQPLDADGRARGAPITLFTENSRLTRLTAAWVGDRLLVAWTGGSVTDDEVRVTVRVRSLGADGTPTRGVATHSGLLGDIGDVLHISPEAAAAASLWVSAIPCETNSAGPPALVAPEDPSAQIEPPRRVLMPQQPMRDAPGAAVHCGPLALHRVWLDQRDEVLRREAVTPLARDLAAPAGDRWAAVVPGANGVTLAWGAASPSGVSFVTADGAPLETPSQPTRPQDLSLRTRSDAEPTLVEAAVPPADPRRSDASSLALLAASSSSLVVVGPGRGTLHLVSPQGAMSVFARSARGVSAITVADGETPWLLAREGQWSGPLRWAPMVPGDGVVWAPLSVHPSQLAAPQADRSSAAMWDEPFARLWVRARTARAVFMRHENTAGALAARPEAPTDPRMPGVIAARNRLRSRWEGVCGQLRARAAQLARGPAGQDVLQGVNSLCEIHADLQLGVPVNPAL